MTRTAIGYSFCTKATISRLKVLSPLRNAKPKVGAVQLFKARQRLHR